MPLLTTIFRPIAGFNAFAILSQLCFTTIAIMAGRKTNIIFYTAPTPNGHKISITLEELGLEYEIKMVNMQATEQKAPWFLAINPNGRVPALSDVMPDGTPINLFESGSIQQYLVDRYDEERKISYEPASASFYITNSWVRTLELIALLEKTKNHTDYRLYTALFSKRRDWSHAGTSQPLSQLPPCNRAANLRSRSLCK